MDHLIPTYKRWPVEIASGQGCTLVDTSGREYLDLTAGIAVASVGHAHPAVVDAISEQAARLIHISNLYVTRPQVELSERLASLTGGMMSWFGNSGAEAIECAIKLVRKRGRSLSAEKHRIIAARDGFHGRTLGALSATGQGAKKTAFEPLVPGFAHVPYDDVDSLEAAMTGDVAAVLLEPIQGEAGVLVPSEGYLRAARELCDRWDAALIVDEIQTGLGRTGRWFAFEHDAVHPDVVCIGKALAGGLPMAACLASPAMAASFEPGDHGSTFGGGPVQSAAALATLDVIEGERLIDRAAGAGTKLMSALDAAFGGAATVRGRGLLIGIALGEPSARAFAAAALERGVLVNDATDSCVRLCPPLVISDAEIDRAVATLQEVWDEIATP